MTHSNYNTEMNFTAVYYANPVCVTAFITPKSLLDMPMYNEGGDDKEESTAAVLSVGVYMSDRSITRICNFTDARKAMKYAFVLKGENCPISKNAMSLIKAEIKRTNVNQVPEIEVAAEPEILTMPKSMVNILEQYEEMKRKHPDAVLLFRVGDFYESFMEDAEIISEVIGINLTSIQRKGKKTYLAGFPNHALDTYLPKLVRAGKRVAICEQLEDPKEKRKRSKKN